MLCGAAPCSSRFLSTPSARRATSSRARYASTCSGFLSTPSARRATQKIFTAGTLHLFLSTPSARRATSCVCKDTVLPAYFYPRPPRGGRLAAALQAKVEQLFLSTPSARRATCALWRSPLFQQISIHALREEGDVQQGTVCVNLFRISIHALREEGDPEDFYCWYPTPISIHALREEGDWPQRCRQRSSSYFYPRPPRGGRRLNISFRDALREFLSTPSARRATGSFLKFTVGSNYFYPRPPRGGRPGAESGHAGSTEISIHALREEGDF